MHNKVELLANDIIYVRKVGDQTEQSLFELIGSINQLATALRAQKKRVLILSNAQKEGTMDSNARKMAATIGRNMDYDKSAAYGAPAPIYSQRQKMIVAAQLNQKVASFKTRKEAINWLLQ